MISKDQESMYQRLIDAANLGYAERKGVDGYTPPECFPKIRSDQVKAALYAVAGVLCDKEPEKNDASEALEYLHARLAGEQDASYKVSMDQVAEAIHETRTIFDI